MQGQANTMNKEALIISVHASKFRFAKQQLFFSSESRIQTWVIKPSSYDNINFLLFNFPKKRLKKAQNYHRLFPFFLFTLTRHAFLTAAIVKRAALTSDHDFIAEMLACYRSWYGISDGYRGMQIICLCMLYFYCYGSHLEYLLFYWNDLCLFLSLLLFSA